MTAPITDIVQINITRDSAGLTRPGFGTALLLSYGANWSGSDLTRTYTSLSAGAVDFAAGTVEYRAMQALFSQTPKPPRVKVGKGTRVPTMVATIGAATVRNSTLYSIGALGGAANDDAEYTSDSAATAAEIHDGLVTALNALSGKNFTAALTTLAHTDFTFVRSSGNVLTAVASALQTGDGPFRATTTTTLPAGMAVLTDYYAIRLTDDTFSIATSRANAFAGTAVVLSDAGTGTHTIDILPGTQRPADQFTVTGDSPGNWFSLNVGTNGDLSIALTHNDPGIADDLDAIRLVDDDWYELLTFYNSTQYAEAAAEWIESNKRIYLAETCNSVLITATRGAADSEDIATTLADAGTSRTAVVFASDPSQMTAVAWSGRLLPTEPGAATWFGKTLNSVTPVNLTDTHRTNLRAKAANWYESLGGRGRTFDGKVANGDYIDAVRDLDWYEADMTVTVAGIIFGNDKVDYDDTGISKIENGVRASTQRAVDRRILSADPAPVIEVPLSANISSADKADRVLADVKVAGELRGAIHGVKPINITISL